MTNVPAFVWAFCTPASTLDCSRLAYQSSLSEGARFHIANVYDAEQIAYFETSAFFEILAALTAGGGADAPRTTSRRVERHRDDANLLGKALPSCQRVGGIDNGEFAERSLNTGLGDETAYRAPRRLFRVKDPKPRLVEADRRSDNIGGHTLVGHFLRQRVQPVD